MVPQVKVPAGGLPSPDASDSSPQWVKCPLVCVLEHEYNFGGSLPGSGPFRSGGAAAKREHGMRRGLISALLASLAVIAVGAVPAQAGNPAAEQMYANDTTVYMIAPPTLATGGPNVPDDLYLAVYPITNGANLGPLTVGSNQYHPQCDPCFHPGVPLPFAYHDHVISGAPGFGTNGTAGTFNPFWHVFVVMYNPSDYTNKVFTPVKSTAELDAGEASGMFLPINRGPGNPFEVDTGIVFLCNIVSSHA
ncbi:MAG TPA: hypothetical protein VGX27_14590, partial [Candidatus Dormibacteraeota bacterium]|nr:hypothetical protein [Candidatus Dormibacteraeota bacterium]